MRLILFASLAVLLSGVACSQNSTTPIEEEEIVIDDDYYSASGADFYDEALGINPKMITWTSSDLSTQEGGWVTGEPPGAPIEGATFVSCGGCDPYQGDVEDTTPLRLLCFKPGDVPEPQGYAETRSARWEARQDNRAIDDWRYYQGWSGGYVGLTRPLDILQDEGLLSAFPLEGLRQANELCQRELNDPDARLLSFHDSGGAWGLAGMIHPRSHAPELLAERAGEERFIIYIRDQQSNPWN
jgi:hypothetical protein